MTTMYFFSEKNIITINKNIIIIKRIVELSIYDVLKPSFSILKLAPIEIKERQVDPYSILLHNSL